MYCTSCGNKITDDSRFCPVCGARIRTAKEEAMSETGRLVSEAKNGDQTAISALYEMTYSQVYYTVKSMIKDEDTVFDILQDSYLKAFSHLDRFEGAEGFAPWVRQIAANTARDHLRKKKPLLFSELNTGDENETPVEELIEDERPSSMPEVVIEQEETKRLIREIIEELPEDQRAAIGMYYYEEMSVKEIAASMGATENAVKSRLLYGRRKIEKKVRELEKKGTKLYGLSPLPFLLLLFSLLRAKGQEVSDPTILRTVLESTAALGAASGTAAGAAAVAGTAGASAGAAAAGTAAGTAAGMSTLKAVLLGIAAAVAVAFATAGILKVALPDRTSEHIEETTVFEEATAETPAAEPTEETEASGQEIQSSESETEPDPLAEALEAYRKILGQAESFNFGEDAVPDGTYVYALEQMHREDTVPTLLLCQNGKDYIDHIRIFYYDGASRTVLEPERVLTKGVAQIGGYRGGLAMMGDGNGMMVSEFGSMRGDMYISRAVRSGEQISLRLEYQGHLDDDDPYRGNAREIVWYERSDPAGFEAYGEAGEGDTTEQDAVISADTEDALSRWIAKEEAAGRVVLAGTVNTYNYDEVVALQGQPDPNAQWSDKSWTYRIIVLDEPQMLSGHQDVDSVERKVSMILVGLRGSSGYELVPFADIPASFDGQHIIFSVSRDLSFPSGTDLPLGQPMTRDVHLPD